MKYLLSFSIMLMICTASCKKKTEGLPLPKKTGAVTMVLQDKPLDTIRKYISGEWQLISSNGGIAGINNTYINTFINFTPSGNLVKTENGNVKINAPIVWKKTRNITTGDSTFMMAEPIKWVFQGISNDSLTTSDNNYDGMGYLLIRK